MEYSCYLQRRFEIIDFSLKSYYTKAFSKPGAKAYVSPEIENRHEDIKAEFPGVTFINHKGMETVYEKEYDIEWEVDVLHEILENSIYPKLKPGDEIEVYAALSEGKEERGQVANRILGRIAEAGADVKKISVLCAYKQGYSWLEELYPAEGMLAEALSIPRENIIFYPYEGGRGSDI